MYSTVSKAESKKKAKDKKDKKPEPEVKSEAGSLGSFQVTTSASLLRASHLAPHSSALAQSRRRWAPPRTSQCQVGVASAWSGHSARAGDGGADGWMLY